MIPAESIRPKVVELLATLLRVKPETITDTSAMGEFPGWDSMAQLSILSALEQEFGIQIDPELGADLHSVGQICDFLRSLQ